MKRLLALALIGLASLLASCGSSVNNSNKPGVHEVFSMVVTPDQFTLNAGDWSTIQATVDSSVENSAAKPISPQPTIKFSSSDSRITVSPAGEVCAGQWDTRYLRCTATSTLPTGTGVYVTITAFDAAHNVGATTRLSVHQRAASINLSVDPTAWATASAPSHTCISQVPLNGTPSVSNQVQYTAKAFDASGNDISNQVNPDDYTWSVADSNIASVSSFGYVVGRSPGVTSVFVKLNGTVSQPLTFVTCPPKSIVLVSSPFTNGTPDLTNATTADLNLNKGDQKYMTASLLDTNGNSIVTASLNYVTSNPLTGSFSTVLPLTSKLTANTSGRFSVTASCEPATCNAAVADFVLPTGEAKTGISLGFGYPIYSNAIGVNVLGTSGSDVLVTGTTYTDGATLAHVLLVYDSESLTLTHTIELANTPNSLVVAPNGGQAYVGSSDGLVVINLGSFQSSLQTYPITGGISTDVIAGKVIGVSPDSRYVVISYTTDANGVALPQAQQVVYLIDTTGTKAAVRYTIPGISTVTFAADSSNFWIAGTSGVYEFLADTFVPIGSITPTDAGLSTHVKALAWMADGQSYFASGDQIVNYSTCDSQKPNTSLPGNPMNLDSTTIGGSPHVFGLSGSQWYDYGVTTTAQAGNATPQGNVCLSGVSVNATPTATSTLKCTPTQISFSPRLEAEFITGVDPTCATANAESLIHGYDAVGQKEIAISTANATPIIPLSGGILNDGRKLYVGTYDTTAKAATLRRFDLSTGTVSAGTLTDGTLAEDASVSTQVIPSFVAVVPK